MSFSYLSVIILDILCLLLCATSIDGRSPPLEILHYSNYCAVCYWCVYLVNTHSLASFLVCYETLLPIFWQKIFYIPKSFYHKFIFEKVTFNFIT